MGEIVALNHEAQLDYGEPDGEVVEKLEWLLAEAMAGNVRGLIYGTVSHERSLINGWAGGADSHDIVAVAAKVFHQVMAADANNWD